MVSTLLDNEVLALTTILLGRLLRDYIGHNKMTNKNPSIRAESTFGEKQISRRAGNQVG